MSNFLSNFGTYTAGTDGAVGRFQFEYLCTLAIAALIIFVGRLIVNRVHVLKQYGFPAPIVAGILFSAVVSIIKIAGIIDIRFDTTFMRGLLQNIFFLCVGFGFSTKTLHKAGSRLCIMIVVSSCLIITLQGVVGLIVAAVCGRSPLFGLITSAGAMSGGVGTASAFGPIFEGWGFANATTIGVAAGVIGNIMGSVIGGPVAVMMIKRHNLKSDPNEVPAEQADEHKTLLSTNNLVVAFAMILLLAGAGKILAVFLNMIPFLDIPDFIGCIFMGAIARNVLDARGISYHLPEMDAIKDVSLQVYLALVMLGTNFADLIPFAGPLSIMLIAQAVLIILFAFLVTYNIFGRNYSAAIMSAGCIGWGCGSGTNAVANEKALMDQYGYDSVAAELYPSFAVIISDIYVPLFLSIVGGFFKT